MIKNFISFLARISPFLAVIILWRLQLQFLNPAGILAIIPIFFYSFVRPIDWFPAMSIFFCLAIDYCFNTKLFWTTAYCVAYAINGFQYFIDLTRTDKNAIVPFMIFFGLALCVLMFINFSWVMFWRSGLLFVWVSVLYTPIVQLLKKVHGDD